MLNWYSKQVKYVSSFFNPSVLITNQKESALKSRFANQKMNPPDFCNKIFVSTSKINDSKRGHKPAEAIS